MLKATQTGHGTLLFVSKKSPAPPPVDAALAEIPVFRPPTGGPPPSVQTFITGHIPSDGSIPIVPQEPPKT